MHPSCLAPILLPATLPYCTNATSEPFRFISTTLTHTHNFIDEVAALKDVEALLEVQNADQLRTTVNELVGQTETLQGMGNKARELMKNNGGIAKQYYKLLLEQWR